jgi:serine/threonine protein kinase
MTGCPEQPILEKILLGQLKGAEAEQWEEHVSNCPHCVDTLAGLDANDLLTAYLRKNRTGAKQAPDPVVRPLIEQIKKLLPGALRDEKTKDVEDRGSRIADRNQSSIVDPRSSILNPQSSILEASESGELGRLAQYRILKRLGQGGMGMVFLAEDLKLDRSVALKVMLPEKRSDPENRMRFLREARAAAAINNERIVTIYQVDEDNDIPFLAMELLEGESLESRLRRQPGPYPLPFLLHIGQQIAEGLHAAHQVGFIHRDIKPSNIWLEAGRVVSGGVVSDEENPGLQLETTDSKAVAHHSTTHHSPLTTHQVKILDFGLARVVRAGPPLTQSGMIVGTPGFLSPEQAAGRPVDARSDLFSLGVVLYLLATGTMPFAGDDVLAILTALAVDHPRPIFERNPNLPEGMAHLIMRLLSKQPEMRPASAAEVIAILQAMETKVQDGNADTEKLKPASAIQPTRNRRWLGWAAGMSAALLLGLWMLLPHLRQLQDSEGKDDTKRDDVKQEAKLPNPSKAKDDLLNPIRQKGQPATPAGPEQTLTLNVHVVDYQAWPAIEAKIKALADSPKPQCESRRSGEYMWVTLRPVKVDPDTFARKINFGRIVGVHTDQRLIYVESGR